MIFKTPFLCPWGLMLTFQISEVSSPIFEMLTFSLPIKVMSIVMISSIHVHVHVHVCRVSFCQENCLGHRSVVAPLPPPKKKWPHLLLCVHAYQCTHTCTCVCMLAVVYLEGEGGRNQGIPPENFPTTIIILIANTWGYFYANPILGLILQQNYIKYYRPY